VKHIGLFYGSSTGATRRTAHSIQQIMHRQTGWDTELLDVAEYYLEEMLDFTHLILGIPTWNHGQLQADWEVVFDELDAIDLSGKYAALYGLGDQVGYPDTFGDAVFFLADKVRMQGAQLVGRWPIKGYTFRQSWAVEEGDFLGLMLDEDNQPHLTDGRINHWVTLLIKEFK
jgi:flavodoxin I